VKSSSSRSAATQWKRLDVAPPLHDQIHAQLRQSLMSGEFAPGERIDVRGLAVRLGTSPMPVRDALRRLEAVGAVVILPKRAPTIATLTAQEYDEITTMRKLLESRAVARAAERATPNRVAVLRRIQAEIRDHARAGRIKAAMVKNSEFHTSLYELADEPTVLGTIFSLWLRVGPYLGLVVPTPVPGKSAGDELFRHHQELLDAVAAGRAKPAVQALLDDIDAGYRAYQLVIGRPARVAEPRPARRRLARS
jgi:GntR family colanic acid and biofilm gene transcriptional regulator